MKIFTRAFFLAAAVAATGLVSACSDKNEEPAPTPDPTPTYRVGHLFHYPTTNTSDGSVYPSQDVKAEARLFAQVLALDFDAGTDLPHFEINRTQLKAGWVGSYPFSCRTRPTDPVFVSYSYRTADGGYRIFRFSNFSQTLTGDVTITAYDEKRQLVSGYFEVNAPNELAPTATSLTEKCNIMLFGEFKDMKVKPAQ